MDWFLAASKMLLDQGLHAFPPDTDGWRWTASPDVIAWLERGELAETGLPKQLWGYPVDVDVAMGSGLLTFTQL